MCIKWLNRQFATFWQCVNFMITSRLLHTFHAMRGVIDVSAAIWSHGLSWLGSSMILIRDWASISVNSNNGSLTQTNTSRRTSPPPVDSIYPLGHATKCFIVIILNRAVSGPWNRYRNVTNGSLNSNSSILIMCHVCYHTTLRYKTVLFTILLARCLFQHSPWKLQQLTAITRVVKLGFFAITDHRRLPVNNWSSVFIAITSVRQDRYRRRAVTWITGVTQYLHCASCHTCQTFVISRGGPWATVAAGETKFCTERTANSHMLPPPLPPPRRIMVATNDVKFVFYVKIHTSFK